jgi:hypothetical protein
MPMLRWLALTACLCLGAHASGAQPGVRNGHALLYDGRGVVLFGGADQARVRADTWRWDGSIWRQVATAGPEGRTFPAVASDMDRGVGYVFGGNRVLFGHDSLADTFLGDLWMWNGQSWSLLSRSGPAPRAEAAMIYDQRRRRLVLFGGYRTVRGVTTRYGDTWEWDGHVWTPIADTGPSPRNNAAMAYDPNRHVAVLFGGSDGAASGETWEWDGRRWVRSPATTDPRYNAVMWYDPATRRMLRFGGWSNGQRWDDTWAYDGTQWSRLDVKGPSARNHSAVAYDPKRRRLVMFGGHDGEHVFGDVWEWSGSDWVEAARTPPILRVDNGH